MILINNEDIFDEIKSKYVKELVWFVEFNVEKLKVMGFEVIRDQIIMYKNGVICYDIYKVVFFFVDLLRDQRFFEMRWFICYLYWK